MLKQIFTVLLAVTFLAACTSSKEKFAQMTESQKAMAVKLSKLQQGEFIVGEEALRLVRTIQGNPDDPLNTFIFYDERRTEKDGSKYSESNGRFVSVLLKKDSADSFTLVGVCRFDDPCYEQIIRRFVME